MNIANDGSKYGADQYRLAHNYDLKSSSFTIVADGQKYTMSFAGREKLTFDNGNGSQEFDYECHKIEDDTYFVRFGEQAAVLELAGSFATLVLSDGYHFGAIDTDGQTGDGILHGFTDEVVGTTAQWVLGCDKFVTHKYDNADSCKVAWSPKGDDFADCTIKYVKIKDAIYLIDVTGAIPDDAPPPPRSNRYIALQDYDHMLFVGCILGKSPPLMIGGYGEFPDL